MRRRADGVALLALVALVVVLFRESLLAGGVFFQRDIHLIWHPQIEGFVRAIRGGAWPLWDPSPAFGQPLLADPGAEVLYPPTWLCLVLPPWTYYTLFAFGHVLFTAVAFYALMRRLSTGPVAAFTGASLWVLGGPFLSLVDLWHHFASAAWIPAVFLAAERAAARRRLRDVGVLALTLGLQILAGSGDMCAITMLALAAWTATLHVPWRSGWRAQRGVLLGGGLAVALAVVLSAGLWLTTLDVVSRSSRRALPEAVRTYWSLHPLELVETMAPGIPGWLPLAPAVREALGRTREPFLSSLYLGLPAVALVAAGVFGPGAPRRRRVLLATVGCGAALVALGDHAPFFDLVTTIALPLRLLRYPVKAMVLVAFAWALLGGLGAEVWRSAGPSGRWARAPALLLAVLGGTSAAVAATLVVHPEAWGGLLDLGPAPGGAESVLRLVGGALASRAALAAAALGLIWTARAGKVRPTILAAGLAAIAVADLGQAHPRPNPVAPPALYTHRPEVLDALAPVSSTRVYSYDYSETGVAARRLGRPSAHTLARVPAGWPMDAAQALGMQMSLEPQTAGRWGLRQAYDADYRGLQAESLARLTRLVRLAEDWPGRLAALLRLGAVTHVVALHRVGGDDLVTVATIPGLFEDPILVRRVPHPLPRTFVVGGVRVANGWKNALETVLDPAFDPSHEVLLPEGVARREPPGFAGSSRILEETADRIRIEAELSADGHVVLVDGHDPGWRATVDGEPAPVLRANVAFRAVAARAGRHVVEMVYRPPAALAGLVVSGLGLLLIVVLLLRPARSAA
jgi:hypothetical protein